MAFNPNFQERLVATSFDPLEMMSSALNTRNSTPWDSIIDFAIHPSYCNFPIMPKQATLLKLIFLETENMTQFDVDTINDWRDGFTRIQDVYGVQPDIWERIEYLKARGYRRFPHIQAVLGRRASKGIIGAFLGCEQMAFLHSLDNPQPLYAVAEHKDVFLNVGATSQTVAMRQLFADLRTMVEGCNYFSPSGRPTWIAESKDHVLRVRTPSDLRRIAELKAAKIPVDHQIATLCAVALGASSVAGRGSTSFCNIFDEFAFHVQTGSVKSDTQIYKDWQPNLGQFGIDALTYVPSSPWTRVGMFHTLYAQGSILMSTYADEHGIGAEARQTLVNNGVTMELDAEPSWLIFQGPSWALYEQWEDTPTILAADMKRTGNYFAFPKAPEPDLTDERQIRERRRDPEKFRVEKGGQFAEVQGAYLDRDKVDQMFQRPHTRDPVTGEWTYWHDPLEPVPFGAFNRTYRMHCDPGLSGANFAMAIGHLEDAPPDEHGHVWPHVVFDLLKVWRPHDYPEDPVTKKQYIDYVQVHNDLESVIDRFPSLDKVTFDQWQSQSFIAQLRARYMPNITVMESTFTDKVNQERMGKFKSALNLGWVHSYADNFYTDDLSCLLELELKYLYVANNGKVVKNDVGPVVTKDLADCVMEVTVDLLGDALDGWRDSVLNAHAVGSSDVAGLRSGREFERLNSTLVMQGLASQGLTTATAKETLSADLAARAKAAQRNAPRRYQGDRLSNIHSRNNRDTPPGRGRTPRR